MRKFNNIFLRTFASLSKSTFPKVEPNLGKPAKKTPFPTYFNEIKTAPPKGESFTLPTIPIKTWLSAFNVNYTRPPVSAFYTMQVKETTYHVFNASRISLGRMAQYIAFVIQGKAHPFYKSYQVDYRDRVVIVNARFAKLTGKKLEQKLYRHHTTYPGGLKEIKAKHYLEKNASEMLKRTIKGMLPKNKLRKEYLSKVTIFDEAGHDLHHLGLPQFTPVEPLDMNKVLRRPDLFPDEYEIAATNLENEDEIPAHLKDKFKVNIDKELYKPNYMTQKSDLRFNTNSFFYYNKALMKYKRKWGKRIRNMGYRFK